MKCCIILGILAFMVLDISATPIWSNAVKDDKNGKDFWSNSILNDYGSDNPFKHRMLNERLRQHYKMRNGKNLPFTQSVRPLYMQNTNMIGTVENEMNPYEKEINYDSNDDDMMENAIDEGIWSNKKWTK